MLVRRRKRRKEIAELLEALLEKHPHEVIYLAWDNAFTHQDDEVEAVVQGAAGRLVLLYLPTYSPWLNPAEMLWRHFRREVTHCELFESVKALVEASLDFFRRYNERPEKVLSIIGTKPQLSPSYLGDCFRAHQEDGAYRIRRAKKTTVVRSSSLKASERALMYL